MPTTTPNYGLTKPDVSGSDGAWGPMLNGNFDIIDTGMAAALSKAGGTLTGPVIAAADPTAALGMATKQYVEGHLGPRNTIINGNFGVNQRGYVSGTAITAAAYGHDRWKAGAGGCTYTFAAPAPDTQITITAGTLTQVIEGGNIFAAAWRLSWAGTAQARVYQGSPTGAYAASPLTVSGLTVGTNTIVEFNAGTLGLAQFEAGSVATPFEHRKYSDNLTDCCRYYATGIIAGTGYAIAGNVASWPFSLPNTMRATPTMVGTDLGSSNMTIPTPGFAMNNTRDGYSRGTATATGGCTFYQSYKADADF
jgi:hypothetical protein